MTDDQALSEQICLTLTRQGPVAHIAIDNPGRKNAVNLATWRHLAYTVGELGKDRETRVIVLSGAGGDFCAGADISEFDAVRRDAATARSYEAANSDAFRALRDSAIPVIAAIGGVCFGGGFGLAAACDLRIASEDARFAVPAARLGLAYPADAMIDIVASSGDQMARYLTMTAATIDAAAAMRAGFLLEVLSTNQLAIRATEIATTIAANAPLSIRASRLAISATVSHDATLLATAKTAGDATFESKDYTEGRSAFRERRKPVFYGR